MRELSEIMVAFEALCAEGKPAALATVIAVEGSTYRSPGARMLVAEDGRYWGGVSGGCLDRDVILRARGVMAAGKAVRARYETTDDEDLASGVATGCRGTVEVFIEPVSAEAPGPMRWVGRVIGERRSIAMATVLGESCARLVLDYEGKFAGDVSGAEMRREVEEAMVPPGEDVRARVVRIGGADVFIELIAPPQALVVFGGGPDVVPVVRIAKALGWHVSVVAGRPVTGLGERFAEADRLLVTSSDEPTAGVALSNDVAVVLMTHNYPRDVRILTCLGCRPRYLGILGPRARTDELLAEVRSIARDVYAPVGLDLGAESPEEIALAIVAEIQAVVRGAAAGFLRDRTGPIHARREAETVGSANDEVTVA
jgi:xanthine/CO dehydrogenase XdhC/CoxF family maturation factor